MSISVDTLSDQTTTQYPERLHPTAPPRPAPPRLSLRASPCDDTELIAGDGEGEVATINVRQLDDEVVRRLKQRASGNNRSLEGEVRHILEGAVADAVSDKRASFPRLAARLRRGTEGRPHTPSEVLIREDRTDGHRVIR